MKVANTWVLLALYPSLFTSQNKKDLQEGMDLRFLELKIQVQYIRREISIPTPVLDNDPESLGSFKMHNPNR